MKKTKIVVVVNQKGGVGKSTLAFHLAHAAFRKNKDAKVLCLDLDSQGNLSQYLTGDLDIIQNTDTGVGLFLEGKDFTPTKTTHPGIDLLHGHKRLDKFDNDENVEAYCYSSAVQTLLCSLGYDYVIIDTPTAVGIRHLAGLCWADIAVIPMEPVMSSIVGFQDVLSAIDQLIGPVNPGLKWAGVVNRANMRVKSHREKDSWLRDTYGDRIFATFTTRSSVSDAMEETPALPVWSHRSAPKELREGWQKFCEMVIA